MIYNKDPPHRIYTEDSSLLQTGYCLLHFVTKRQWQSVLEQLLTHPLCVDCRTDKGVTPLIMAASRGDSCCIQALLEAGADITLEDQV